jgi:hypothetical protein
MVQEIRVNKTNSCLIVRHREVLASQDFVFANIMVFLSLLSGQWQQRGRHLASVLQGGEAESLQMFRCSIGPQNAKDNLLPT